MHGEGAETALPVGRGIASGPEKAQAGTRIRQGCDCCGEPEEEAMAPRFATLAGHLYPGGAKGAPCQACRQKRHYHCARAVVVIDVYFRFLVREPSQADKSPRGGGKALP